MQASLERFSDSLSRAVRRAKEPQNLPYTIVAGTATAVVVGVAAYRWITAPAEGKLSDDQQVFEDGVTVKTSAGSSVVTRVPRTTAGFAEAGAILASSYADNPMMKASVAKDVSDDKREAAARWLFERLARSAGYSSTGALVLRSAPSKEATAGAVAVVFPPGVSSASAQLQSEMFWQGTWGYLTVLGSLQGLGRLLSLGEVTEMARERLTSAVAKGSGYVYVMSLGGTDAGSRAGLLSAVGQMADRKGVVCFSETYGEDQDSELKSAGFEVVDERPQLFGLTVRYWMRAARDSSGRPVQDINRYALSNVDTGGYAPDELEAGFKAHEEEEARKAREQEDEKKAKAEEAKDDEAGDM